MTSDIALCLGPMIIQPAGLATLLGLVHRVMACNLREKGATVPFPRLNQLKEPFSKTKWTIPSLDQYYTLLLTGTSN